MTGTFEALLAATACFVFGHFVLSSLSVRRGIARAVGDGPFRALYSLFAAASLTWTGFAYGAAPFVPIWEPPDGMRHLAYLLVLIACFLVVTGITTKSPTAVGGERMADDPAPLGGILTVTRHPFLVGVGLWAVSHLLVNGDLASIILFSGLLFLCVGGIAHIDYRRRDAMGAAWGPVALSTSAIPFLAVLQGRTALDLKGIGLARVAAALGVYAGLAYGHPWIAGVPLF